MNITLTLNDEETDALQVHVDAHNAANPDDQITPEILCARRLMAGIAEDVATDYNTALARLGATAATMPYGQRKALMAAVATQIQGS